MNFELGSNSKALGETLLKLLSSLEVHLRQLNVFLYKKLKVDFEAAKNEYPTKVTWKKALPVTQTTFGTREDFDRLLTAVLVLLVVVGTIFWFVFTNRRPKVKLLNEGSSKITENTTSYTSYTQKTPDVLRPLSLNIPRRKSFKRTLAKNVFKEDILMKLSEITSKTPQARSIKINSPNKTIAVRSGVQVLSASCQPDTTLCEIIDESENSKSELISSPKSALLEELLSIDTKDPGKYFGLCGSFTIVEQVEILRCLENESDQDIYETVENDVLHSEDVLTSKKLRYVLSTIYMGSNSVISRRIGEYKSTLPIFFGKVLQKLDLAHENDLNPLVSLVCDYVYFHPEERETKECFFDLVNILSERCSKNENSIARKALMACVCSVNTNIAPETLDMVFRLLFSRNQHLLAVSCMVFYIGFSKSSLTQDLEHNPTSNKARSAAYRIMRLFLDTGKEEGLFSSENDEVQILLVTAYKLLVEIFLNTERIPSSVQYEILSEYIVKFYRQLEHVGGVSAPKLKDLDI